MRIKIVVFPVKGRNWCFAQSVDPSIHGGGGTTVPGVQSSNSISTFKELYGKLVSSFKGSDESRLEVTVDFIANKMNRAWSNLEKAPQGTLKNKIHGIGLKLLSRVKPSETFFRSIPKQVAGMDIVYPSSLNPRLVHRRLRHLAFRGSALHEKYLYGSAILLPLTSIFTVLPLPNIPFFWILFRTYSHWRASQGSKKIIHLMSEAGSEGRPYGLQPSEELRMIMESESGNGEEEEEEGGLSHSTIAEICRVFHLNSSADALFKYRNSSLF